MRLRDTILMMRIPPHLLPLVLLLLPLIIISR